MNERIKKIIQSLFILELLICSPAVVVIFLIYLFDLESGEADYLVDWLIKYRITWVFSLLIWFLLYLFIF